MRSSKAARLTHIRPGYYRPPGAPIFVPGMNWLAVLLVGRRAVLGPPLLAAMRWWTTRGWLASFKRDEEARLLIALAARWGRQVVHLFDQGFAGSLWVGLLLAFNLRFVLRWRKDDHLLDEQGNRRPASHITRGKRRWSQRTMWESRHGRWINASVLALPVAHPDHPEKRLWLVLCRRPGQEPWYVLTDEAITTQEQAWQVVFASARRWPIEQTWRYDKSELADHQSATVALGEP